MSTLTRLIGRAITAIKQCEGCAMKREAMKRMIAAGIAHAERLAALKRGEDPDAKAQVTAEQAGTATVQAEGTATTGQATDAPTAHRKRTVAKTAGASAGKGRASVQGMRKTRGR